MMTMMPADSREATCSSGVDMPRMRVRTASVAPLPAPTMPSHSLASTCIYPWFTTEAVLVHYLLEPSTLHYLGPRTHTRKMLLASSSTSAPVARKAPEHRLPIYLCVLASPHSTSVPNTPSHINNILASGRGQRGATGGRRPGWKASRF
eukprot:2212157-Rhodomonas_salina.2